MENLLIDMHTMTMILKALEQADEASQAPGANAYSHALRQLTDGGVDAAITAYEKDTRYWFMFKISIEPDLEPFA